MRIFTKSLLAFCLISFAAAPTYACGFMRWRCCRPVVVSSCCCRPVVVPCCCCSPSVVSEWPAAEPSQHDAGDVPAAPAEEHAGESEAPEAAVEEAPPEA